MGHTGRDGERRDGEQGMEMEEVESWGTPRWSEIDEERRDEVQ